MEKMVRAGKLTPGEVLARAPLDRIDRTVTFPKQHAYANEVCKAVRQRIAKAAPNDFEALKNVYFKHCASKVA